MTSPGNFDYRDDSIVARISVDVPASAVTDLDQIRSRTSSIRVEQEAIARSTGDWIGYLQSIPQIAEQVNQSYRNMITSLERISYIQQELGGLNNVGATGTAPMGHQGVAPYSTAAPAGYVDPFTGMPGQGAQMGMMGAPNYMQSMMMNNPAMFANMAAQRGNYVNPALLGFMGSQVASHTNTGVGGTGGGQGWGAPPPASSAPQPTQRSRDSAAPPDQTQSGQPSTSEPQNIPDSPHPDAPEWQKQLASMSSTAANIVNETRGGMSKGVIAGGAALVGALASRFGGGGGGDDGSGGGGGGGGGLGGLGGFFGGGGGSFSSVLRGAGIAGAGVTAALGANKIIQNAGEQIQQYRNLGAESGGGAAEGFGYEMQARMMAINPFLTLEQSRSIMQTALKNGYTGKEFDTVSQMMAENLKDMNMSSAQSMDIWMSTVEKGKVSVKDFSNEMDRLKDLTRLDGNTLSQSTRNAQFAQTASALQGLGLQGQQLTDMTTSINEAFSDNRTLNKVVPQATVGALQDPSFLMMMAQANGIQGVGDPMEVLMRMQEQGISGGQATGNTYKYLASMAQKSSGGDLTRGATIFWRLLQQMGVQMGPAEARELYSQMVGGNQDAFQRGLDKATAASMDPGTIGEQIGNIARPLRAPFDLLKGAAGMLLGPWGGGLREGAADDLGKDFTAPIDQIKRSFAGPDDVAQAEMDARRANAPHATGPTQTGPGSGYRAEGVKGEVNGELRIVVDRDGNVHAPNSIQLSGSQQAVNSGYGSGTLNNPGPGDPNYQHAYTGWRSGG